jgi:hypothetical protein
MNPFAAGSGTSEDPFQIATIEQLQAIDDTLYLSSHFVQIQDIDASASAKFQNESGFNQIGDAQHPFTGSYDGNGFTIRDLSLNFNRVDKHNGLFGYAKNARLQNIFVDNRNDLQNKTGAGNASALASSIPPPVYDYTQGDLSEIRGIGGLVGTNDGGIIQNCHFTGFVDGDISQGVAGLVGVNNGVIKNSSFEGRAGGGTAFGLAGWNIGEIRRSRVKGFLEGMTVYGFVSTNDGLIIESAADVELWGSATAGLVRHNRNGKIESTFAVGSMNGRSLSAGLVAINSGQIKNSYSQTAIKATIGEGFPDIQRIGGLVGENQSEGIVETSYTTGSVSLEPPDGLFLTGGVAARNSGEIRATYWDLEAIGLQKGAGEGASEDATGLNTAQMTGPSATQNMPGFDFETVWATTPEGYPVLRWQVEE